MSVKIIDVSHHQQKINWDKVKAAGVEAVFIKCTNGSHNTDDMYKYNSSEARRVGIKVGAYHFMLASQNPEEQADNFLANKGFTELFPVVDIEWDNRNNVDQWKNVPEVSRIAMIGRFIQSIINATNMNPIIYTSAAWWKPMIGAAIGHKKVIFANCPLWIADYTSKKDEDLFLSIWRTEWTIRQYSAKGKIDGIVTDVDINRFNTDKDLTSLTV